MNTFKRMGLAAVIALGAIGPVAAAPLSVAPGDAVAPAQTSIEKAYVVCGPYRCWHRGYRPAYRRCFIRYTYYGPRRFCRW